jgi:hypothetical protein
MNGVGHRICAGKWLEIAWHAEAEMLDVRDNLVTSDPNFAGGVDNGFRIPMDSPAWDLGFEAIPVSEIGLRTDADREHLAELK